MFYLIESGYVGPNRKDSTGAWIGDSRVMSIYTTPGRTNMSNNERTEGWLGTTNDNSVTAHGEFETIDDARAIAHEMGFTQEWHDEDDNYAYGDENDTPVEQWISESAARDQVDAGDWFINGLGRAGTCSSYGITAGTTDDELAEIVERAEKEARGENAELHGTGELFTALRDELIEERNDD